MSIEVVILVVLAAAFVVMKVIQGDMDRKRRLERSERLLRDRAATGGFSEKKKWDDFAEEHGSYEDPEADEPADDLAGEAIAKDGETVTEEDENGEPK